MAPLPQNNTARVFFDYVTGNVATSQEHTVAIRGSGPTTNTDDAQGRFLAFLQAIQPQNLAAGWRVVRVRLQQAGSNFSIPLARIAGLASFQGGGAGITPANEAREFTWQGRSQTSGRRVDFSIYGLNAALPDNFRYPAGGSSPAWVASSLAVLAANPANLWTCIDFSAPTWYSYVNVQFNSYWEARIRNV